MHLLERTDEAIVIRLTPVEAAALSNALNEALEFLGGDEFDTRMGISKTEAERLLDTFQTEVFP